MLRDLLAFLPLAVWCNTAAGPPFDPLLLVFTGRHPFPAAWAFVLAGSACAGVGAALEARLVDALSGEPRRPRARFYVMALLVAASPVPFTLLRAAAAAGQPRPWPYAAAVAAGRVPRYLAVLALWSTLTPPAWVAPAGVVVGVASLLVPALRSGRLRSLAAAARDRVAAAWARERSDGDSSAAATSRPSAWPRPCATPPAEP